MDADTTKHIGYLIKETADKIEAQGNSVLRQYGLTFTQSRVLAFLDKHGGKTTQKELEVHLGVSHPTVVGIVARLERDGFLRCWQDESDRRVKNIALTKKAGKIAGDLNKLVLRDEKKLSADLSEDEIRELVRLLSRISAQMDRINGKGDSKPGGPQAGEVRTDD